MTLDEALVVYELVWGDTLLHSTSDWRPGEQEFCKQLALSIENLPACGQYSRPDQRVFIALRDLKQRREWSRNDDLEQQETVDLRIRGPAR